MKKLFFLATVFLFCLAGFQESASAQPPVTVVLSGPADNLNVDIRPYRVTIPTPAGKNLIVQLVDGRRLVTSIAINNTGKTQGGACPAFSAVPVTPTSALTVIQDPLAGYAGNASLWCKYNIVLIINNQTVTIDPDFRIWP